MEGGYAIEAIGVNTVNVLEGFECVTRVRCAFRAGQNWAGGREEPFLSGSPLQWRRVTATVGCG